MLDSPACPTGTVSIIAVNALTSGPSGLERPVGTRGKLSLMGHKDLRATAVYVEELSLEEKKQLLDDS